jgi:hypothetical protein
VALPAGRFSNLLMLATGVHGAQTAQTFVVKYTDESSSVFTRSLSDWFSPQGYAGEAVALAMPYRLSASGAPDDRTFNLYGYSFAIDNTKTVAGITLPGNRNVVALALTLQP